LIGLILDRKCSSMCSHLSSNRLFPECTIHRGIKDELKVNPVFMDIIDTGRRNYVGLIYDRKSRDYYCKILHRCKHSCRARLYYSRPCSLSLINHIEWTKTCALCNVRHMGTVGNFDCVWCNESLDVSMPCLLNHSRVNKNSVWHRVTI